MTVVDLSPRDLAIVKLVTRFKQLTTAHINELLFPANSSRSSCDRALHRLTKQNYLHRIERRAPGGRIGGSGHYVYALGRRGFFLSAVGQWRPARSVDYHALEIAETYLALHRLALTGRLAIAGYSTEPHCWQVIGGIELKPDMTVELVRPDTSARMTLWLEIDMGTEGQNQVLGKLARYWRAYEQAEYWPHRIVFIAVDAERSKELNWLLGKCSEEQRELFRSVTLPELTALLVP